MSPWWFCPISAMMKQGWEPPIILPGHSSNLRGILVKIETVWSGVSALFPEVYVWRRTRNHYRMHTFCTSGNLPFKIIVKTNGSVVTLRLPLVTTFIVPWAKPSPGLERIVSRSFISKLVSILLYSFPISHYTIPRFFAMMLHWFPTNHNKEH